MHVCIVTALLCVSECVDGVLIECLAEMYFRNNEGTKLR